jgi:hypothetical protein
MLTISRDVVVGPDVGERTTSSEETRKRARPVVSVGTNDGASEWTAKGMSDGISGRKFEGRSEGEPKPAGEAVVVALPSLIGSGTAVVGAVVGTWSWSEC